MIDRAQDAVDFMDAGERHRLPNAFLLASHHDNSDDDSSKSDSRPPCQETRSVVVARSW